MDTKPRLADYQLLLFDFDDTLVDFASAERGAVAAVCAHFGRPAAPTALAIFQKLNRALWLRHDAGEVTRDQVFRERFVQFMASLDIKGDADLANTVFLDALAETGIALPGAASLLASLAATHVVGIVSNGHGPTQKKRLARFGFDTHVRFSAVSDEIGVAKPKAGIFEAAYQMSGLPPGEPVLMIGDNWLAEIVGALDYGFDACWYAPAGNHPPVGAYKPFVIRTLSDLTVS